MTPWWRYTVITGILLVISTAWAAENNSNQGSLDFATCKGCHSIAGYTNIYPSYHVPKLGGQNPDYIVAALKEYKNRQRDHATMIANATDLTEQQMRSIANYVSGFRHQDQPANDRQGDPKRGEQLSQTCVACHGKDGNGNPQLAQAGYPRLAGQYADYLRYALVAYRDGQRQNAIMNGQAANLSDQNIADLAAYYASLPNGLTTVGKSE